MGTASASARVARRPPGSRRIAAIVLVVAASGFSCSTTGPTPPCVTCGGGGTNVLVGAGDMAVCSPSTSAGLVATARMLDAIAGTVFAAGDNAYFDGSPAEYSTCYDPYWGRQKARTWPVPGNHDYHTPGASGYYGYFGDAAGFGYYRRAIGSWAVVGLNSEIDASAASAQVQWLRSELTDRPAGCTVAIWHRPLFSSGPNGDNADMRDLWQALDDLNVDVVINGHDHLYERFAPQDADGNPDPQGIQQFTVGTGGAALYAPITIRRNSQVRIAYWGVALFTLLDGSYTWEFRPIDSGGGTDTGSAQCH